jgi:SAM-dependent methyltransferase
MPDLPSVLASAELEASFLRVVDVERKVLAALDALGPIVDRDVLVLDAGSGNLARALAALGARTLAVAFGPAADGAVDADAAVAAVSDLAPSSADVVVIPWSELATPGSPLIEAAERVLRPAGRLLLVHDYGRDEVWGLRPDLQQRLVDWSYRKGPFLSAGFRVRVIHCWWTFESPEQAREMLAAAFGQTGLDLAERMKRQRLEYQVAVYHRKMPAPEVAGVGGVAGDAATEAAEVPPPEELVPELVAE